MLLYAKFDSDKLESVGVPQIWFICPSCFFSHNVSNSWNGAIGGKYCFSHLNPPLKPPQRSKTDDSTMFNRYSWQDIIRWLDPIICVLCSDSTKVAVKWSANLKQFSKGGGIKHVELLKSYVRCYKFWNLSMVFTEFCWNRAVKMYTSSDYIQIHMNLYWCLLKKQMEKIDTKNCHENNR